MIAIDRFFEGLGEVIQGAGSGMNKMERTRRLRGLVIGIAVLVAAPAFAPVYAESAASVAAPETLQVPVGSHKLLRLPSSVGRVAIGEPKIADVNVVNTRELLLLGKSAGTTSLLVWPRAGRKGRSPVAKEYLVSVGGLAGLPADPGISGVTIQPGAGIGGTAQDLFAHRRAALVAGAGTDQKAVIADRSVVALESQVLSEIKVVEVNKTTLQQYGLNLLHPGGKTIQNFTTPGGLSGIQGTGGALTFTSSTGYLPFTDAFNIIFGNNNYLGILSLLERKGLARTLAEPSLTATSGQLATFLAGGEFPVPVPQSTGSGGGTATVTIQYKEFGVRLNLTPTVLSASRISLKVAPEVSELDYANGVNLNGYVVPGLIVRRTDTTVELGDGESFILSGLVSDAMKANVDKVPFLGDLPIIGTFFKTNTMQRSEKELIMVVTPHLVRPFQRNATLPQLPGAQIESYRPNFAETLLEHGNFGQSDHGYSR